MSMSHLLPAVLQSANSNSISMERALNQIKDLLLEYQGLRFESEDAPIPTDRINASLDDVELMLKRIDR